MGVIKVLGRFLTLAAFLVAAILASAISFAQQQIVLPGGASINIGDTNVVCSGSAMVCEQFLNERFNACNKIYPGNYCEDSIFTAQSKLGCDQASWSRACNTACTIVYDARSCYEKCYLN